MSISKINSELVEKYCLEFKSRYLTLSGFKNKHKSKFKFHLFGHWNLIHYDNDSIYHSYLNGDTGNIEKCISKISISDINKILYVRYDETFILFKNKKGIIKPEFVYNKLDKYTPIDKKRLWLYENGIHVTRKHNLINDKMIIELRIKDAFTKSKLIYD